MRCRAVLLCMALMAVHGPIAEASPEAVQLFRDGRELMKQGRLVDACDRFARSERLEPKVGTLLNLADCYEQRGMTASAWGAFIEAKSLAAQAGDARRELEAERRARTLEPRLGYMTIVADVAIHGLVVRRDGQVIDPAVWNAEVPLDPATHEIAAAAPGYLPWSEPRTLHPGGHERVTIALVVDPTSVPMAQGPIVVSVPPPMPHPATISSRSVGIGILAGGSTKEGPVIGGRVFGNLTMPIGLVRGVGSVMYSRYDDSSAQAAGLRISTLYLGGSFDYVWAPVPQLAISAGLGFGLEFDRDSTQTDSGSSFAIRGSPVILRLADGGVEAGLHMQLVFAGDEVTLFGLVGVDWLVR